MSKFCILIFTDGRNDYLQQTLKSLFAKVKFPERPYIVLIDDNPENRDLEFIEKIKKQYRINKMVLNEQRLGIGGSVKEGWKNIPKGCEFVWHQENDFLYNEDIDISLLARVLKNKLIFQFTLLRQAWYENEIEKGGVFAAHKGLFKEANYAGIDLVIHKGFFSHNPSLYRASVVDPDFPNYGEYAFIKALLKKHSNGYCAYLGKLNSEPKVTHIGKVKS
jgi:disulfide oxidoreductase YuzD